MDTLTTEQNFQLTQAIDMIDSLTREVFASPDTEAVRDAGGWIDC